jgi:hypothetical protein
MLYDTPPYYITGCYTTLYVIQHPQYVSSLSYSITYPAGARARGGVKYITCPQ